MNPDLKRQLATANEHYREGRFSDAEQAYLSIYQQTPTHAEALSRLGELALWKNHPKEAEHYLLEAWKYTPWLGRQWLFNIAHHSLLAMTYYRMDRFPQAAHYFKQAAGWGIGPFHDLKALGTQLEQFGNDSPYQMEQDACTQIPFIVTDPLPVIPVSVNGSEPIPFFIDTGGAELIVDSTLAERIGIVRSGTLNGAGGGTTGKVGLGKVDRVKVGEIEIRQLPVHLMDTTAFAAIFDGMPVKGVIGTRLLMHFLATIDYVNGCLRLEPVEATPPLDDPTVKQLPFWLVQDHFMVTQGTLNGQGPMLFFVDTGLAGTGFSAPESVLQKAGITVDWSQATAGVGGFGVSEAVNVVAERVTLGTRANEVVAERLPGVVFKKPMEVMEYRMDFWIGGVASHQFFRPYALTLDFQRMRLILRQGELL